MRAKKILIGIAAAAGIIALVFVFLPFNVNGVNCGSLLIRSNAALVASYRDALTGNSGPDYSGLCAAARYRYLAVVVVFAVIAILMAVTGSLLKPDMVSPADERRLESDSHAVADQLRNIAELRDAGDLSEEEFELAKARILGNSDA